MLCFACITLKCTGSTCLLDQCPTKLKPEAGARRVRAHQNSILIEHPVQGALAKAMVLHRASKLCCELIKRCITSDADH